MKDFYSPLIKGRERLEADLKKIRKNYRKLFDDYFGGRISKDQFNHEEIRLSKSGNEIRRILKMGA